MSDHLDGCDAFDKLLSALIDALHDFSKERILKEQAEARAKTAEDSRRASDSTRVRAEALLKKHNDEGMPKLEELHAAAQAVLIYLENDADHRKRLEKAIALAGPYCGEIPF